MNIGNIGPHLLQDKRNRPLKWETAVSELVDNSFDAAATRVELDFSRSHELTVLDDGNGCGSVQRMLTIADHMPSKTTRLGRYGVGLKDAACWLWGEMRIETVFRGLTTYARVNWDNLSKQSNWEIDDPHTYKPTEELPRGTRLHFKHTKNRPGLDALSTELGYTFWPALSSGRQIILSGPRGTRIACVAWTQPPLSDIIEDSFQIDGKSVTLRVGIVPPDDSNPYCGFNFAYGHRNICNSSLGCSPLSPDRICGVVRLGEGWRLSTNKTAICDDQESLAAALFARCKPILEKAQTQAETLFNHELEMSVTQSLRLFLAANKKAKRHKGTEHGTVDPQGTERTHRRAKRTQDSPGNIEDAVDIGAIQMRWRPRSDGMLGEVDIPGNIVWMNPNHSRLSFHREQRNEGAIVDASMAVLAIEVFESQTRNMFPFAKDHDKLLGALSNLTSGQVVRESKPLASHSQ